MQSNQQDRADSSLGKQTEIEDGAEKFEVVRVTPEGRSNTEDIVAKESQLTIFLNGQELATLLCSPLNIVYLAAGFLQSEGLVKSKDEITKIDVDDWEGVVRFETKGGIDPDSRFSAKRLITSGCGAGATFYSVADAAIPKVTSQSGISAVEVFTLVQEFQHRSPLYRTTGGVHSAALCSRQDILLFYEDIGRHNAIDKIFGKCLLEDITVTDRFILTSGRVSSEVMYKIAARGIPLLISVSAPTSLGVRMADKLGVTLIGHTRGKRMNVYTNSWRVLS